VTSYDPQQIADEEAEEMEHWLSPNGLLQMLDSLARDADNPSERAWHHWTLVQEPLTLFLVGCELGLVRNRAERLDGDGGWYAITRKGERLRQTLHKWQERTREEQGWQAGQEAPS